MVKRVTTNAAGSKAMQILLGRDFGSGNAARTNPLLSAAAGTGISDKAIPRAVSIFQ